MGERHIDPKLAAARMSVRKAGGVGLAGLAGWGDNASSGIGATPGLKKALSLAATSMGCVKMVIEGEQVVGSKVRVNPGDPWGHKLDSLSTYLNETDPVYFALFRGEKQCLLITYVPDNAKPGNKMRYASSKNSVKDAILEIDFGCQLEEFNVTTAHELSYNEYKKRENTPKPFSEAELLRQQQDSSETAGGYGVLARILAQERQRDLISGDANAKPFALPGLTSLSAGITPSALKNKNKGAASSPTSSSTSVPDVHRESPEVLVQQQQQHNIAAEVLSKLKPAPAAVSPVNPIPVVTHVVATVPTHAPVEVSVPPARNLETKTAVHIKETINPDDDEDKDSDVEELALLKEEIVDDGDNVEAMDITALRKKLDDIDLEKKVEKVIEFEDDVDDIKDKPEKVMKSSADEEEDDEEDAKEMKMLMEPEPGVSIPVDEEMLVNVLGRKNVEEEPEKVEVVKAEEKVTTSALFARPKTSDLDDFPQEDDEDEVASVKSSQQKKQNRPVSSKASAQLEDRPASGTTKSFTHLGHISKASSFSKLSKGKGKVKALVKRIADTTETYMRRFSKARVQEVAVPDSKLQSLDDTNGTVTLDDIKSMKDMNDFGAYEKNTIEFNLSEREFMEVFNMDKQAYNKLGKGKKQKLKKKIGIL